MLTLSPFQTTACSYSVVYVLYAVRSAITATAELLVTMSMSIVRCLTWLK